MKHGSHIILQRFVRSTVRTAPRPYLIVLEPWLCSFSSLCAWISRPGNIASIWVRNFESIAIMSSKRPWIGQSLTIQISPSRSIICALISPTFSLMSTDTSFSPLRICSRASMTQFGHSESVVLGHPKVGFVFCQDLRSGLSDHFGVKEGFGLYLFTDWMALNSPPATSVKPRSATLIAFIYIESPFRGLYTNIHESRRNTRAQPLKSANSLQTSGLLASNLILEHHGGRVTNSIRARACQQDTVGRSNSQAGIFVRRAFAELSA